jgi:site-specific recombinase XerD
VKVERLQVLERKAGHATAYPLAGVVAEAIIDYLKHGRPKTGGRHLFFPIYAPQAPITAAAVSSSVAHYLHKAGIQARRAGSHTLRHTCVQHLIDTEFPLKTIGDDVGHRSPESTSVPLFHAEAPIPSGAFHVKAEDRSGPQGHLTPAKLRCVSGRAWRQTAS